jgi:uncharacterized repeat protein (TIGR03837 family)
MGTAIEPSAGTALSWDIFCRVVDNYGDIGVCWRLAAQLAGRGQAVRLWVDDPAALQWMAPDGCPGVRVFATLDPGAAYEPADVVIEAFGLALPAGVESALARVGEAGSRRVAWINLEYLSAQAYAARSHGLASPVPGGASAGVRKWFFFPGFTPDTGGLLREPDLLRQQAQFDRAGWLASQGIACPGELVVSLFCYEPPVLGAWLQSLAQVAATRPVRLLVTHGRAQAAVQQALAQLPAAGNPGGALTINYLRALPQVEFDHLLWSSDVNFVRGEDSLVRALWAGVPFIWQIYPQQDQAHHAKLRAFLDVVDRDVPASLRGYFQWWNAAAAGPPPPLECEVWRPIFAAVRRRLAGQTDLVTRLLRFVAENR